MKETIAAILALLFLAAPAAAQEDTNSVTPLFASDSVLEVTISGPIARLVRAAARSTDPFPAQISAEGETHAIELSARGNSRRDRATCRFPPLRIELTQQPADASLFFRQKRIKLVTHCRESDAGEQTLLREYAAYRLYNAVTPESFRVRLARITYVDDGKPVTTRYGFLIEDIGDAARRLGLKEIKTGSIRIAALDREDAVRYSVFQYLIGNTDWGMLAGPDPADCCHNSKLLGESKAATGNLTPMPYDFDNSGLIDAPYALPSSLLNLRSVTTRLYRGFCQHNDLVVAEAARLVSLRATIEAEVAAVPDLSEKTRSEMLRYLAGGFDGLNGSEAIERNLLRKCR